MRRMRRLTFVAAVLLGLIVLSVGGTALYAARALSRFERVEARRSTLLYAAPPVLRTGVNVSALDLAGLLGRLGYRETKAAGGPGQFSRTDSAWEIRVNGTTTGRITLSVAGNRITRLRQGGTEVESVALPPELLASAGADMGESIRPVRLADVPAPLRAAVLATEDVRFYEHGGVDPRGILRAMWTNVRKGRVAEGGSTITQQLIKSRLLTPERTLSRKIHEALLSTALEWRYSKDQIFEAYLNEVYLGQAGGSSVRGIGAAARAYFGKEVHQLTLAESALLAGMIRAPNSYSPVSNPDRARERSQRIGETFRKLELNAALELLKAGSTLALAREAPGVRLLCGFLAAERPGAEVLGQLRAPRRARGDQQTAQLFFGQQPFQQRRPVGQGGQVRFGVHRLHQLAQARHALLRRVAPGLGHQGLVEIVDQRLGAGQAVAQLGEDVGFGRHVTCPPGAVSPVRAANGPPVSAKQGSARVCRAISRSTSSAANDAGCAPAITPHSRPPMKRMQGTASPNTLQLASMSFASTKGFVAEPRAAAMTQVPVDNTVHGPLDCSVSRCRSSDALLSWMPQTISQSVGKPVSAASSGRSRPSRAQASRRSGNNGCQPWRSTRLDHRPSAGRHRSVWQPNDVTSLAATPQKRQAQYCGYISTCLARANSAG